MSYKWNCVSTKLGDIYYPINFDTVFSWNEDTVPYLSGEDPYMMISKSQMEYIKTKYPELYDERITKCFKDEEPEPEADGFYKVSLKFGKIANSIVGSNKNQPNVFGGHAARTVTLDFANDWVGTTGRVLSGVLGLVGGGGAALATASLPVSVAAVAGLVGGECVANASCNEGFKLHFDSDDISANNCTEVQIGNFNTNVTTANQIKDYGFAQNIRTGETKHFDKESSQFVDGEPLSLNDDQLKTVVLQNADKTIPGCSSEDVGAGQYLLADDGRIYNVKESNADTIIGYDEEYERYVILHKSGRTISEKDVYCIEEIPSEGKEIADNELNSIKRYFPDECVEYSDTTPAVTEDAKKKKLAKAKKAISAYRNNCFDDVKSIKATKGKQEIQFEADGKLSLYKDENGDQTAQVKTDDKLDFNKFSKRGIDNARATFGLAGLQLAPDKDRW